eukprot:TRINITY_DN5761_c0_g1_i1.p1 TRINITY_DN5761_c0_g1~~TRINITY_DN5761_c0_g1_i1.p1  ORF type:complete len:378 (-),score=52.48 TRINITY_DN5761_c0_g1_i1:206-1339(-)
MDQASKNDVFVAFQPEEHDIVDLSAFARGWEYYPPEDTRLDTAIASLQTQLSTKGWSIVRLPSKLCDENVATLQKHAMDFFATPESEKSKASEKFGFGFSKTNHKEGIRIVSRGEQIGNNFPEPLSSDLTAISAACDELSPHIMGILSQKLFEFTSTDDLAEKANLPSACRPVSMIDIAHYFNNESAIDPPEHGLSVKEVNCVPHIDPGLLSISFLSSAEGLQLHDPVKNVWVSGPNSWLESQRNLGVLWLGEAARIASSGNFIPGVHRVIYPKSKGDRLTMWFEICTKTQLEGPAAKFMEEDAEILIPAIKGPNAKKKVKKGDKLENVLREVEFDMGVPMSKTLFDEDAEFPVPDTPVRPTNIKQDNSSSSTCCML